VVFDDGDGSKKLNAAVLGFWGMNTSNVFAVGGTLVPEGGQAMILQYNGDTWSRMPTPSGTPTLWWVYGLSAEDVWAVGEAGTILHFNGTMWAVIASGGAYTLWGIWGATPTDLWAVGGSVDSSTPSTILHYDGSDWSEVPGVGQHDEFFFKVWGSAANDVYVIGDGGALLHYDGKDWARLESGTTERLITVNGTGRNDVWVVGGLGNDDIGLFESVLLHKTESGWSRLDATDEGLMGVCASGVEQPVLISGFRGVVLLGRDKWKQRRLTRDDLHATWCDEEGNYLVGGGNLEPNLMMDGHEPRGVIFGTGVFEKGVLQ